MSASRDDINSLCCRGLLDPEFCEDRYLTSNPNHQCDAIIYDYCQINKDDEICACINSPLEYPDCHDQKCRESGAHITRNMLAKKCPTVIECNQYVNLSDDAKNNVVNVDQYQYCGVDEGGEKVDKQLGPPPDASSQFGEFVEDVRFGRKSSRLLLGTILGSVAFLIVIIIVIVLLLRPKK